MVNPILISSGCATGRWGGSVGPEIDTIATSVMAMQEHIFSINAFPRRGVKTRSWE